MLGERKPDIVQMDPSWHHNYASLGWFSAAGAAAAPHYPETRPELVPLTAALHALAHDGAARTRFRADAVGFADGFALDAEHRQLLFALDQAALVRRGVHPLVAFLARMQVEHDRRG
jgi:2,3-dihydroxyphenylpropionate 1,2-dioxygenase